MSNENDTRSSEPVCSHAARTDACTRCPDCGASFEARTNDAPAEPTHKHHEVCDACEGKSGAVAGNGNVLVLCDYCTVRVRAPRVDKAVSTSSLTYGHDRADQILNAPHRPREIRDELARLYEVERSYNGLVAIRAEQRAEADATSDYPRIERQMLEAVRLAAEGCRPLRAFDHAERAAKHAALWSALDDLDMWRRQNEQERGRKR